VPLGKASNGLRMPRPTQATGLRHRPATVPIIPPPLDQTGLALAARELAARDPSLARIAERYGLPPLWSRPAGTL
jgi:hypothetical protein